MRKSKRAKVGPGLEAGEERSAVLWRWLELMKAFGGSCTAMVTLKGLPSDDERWQSLEDLLYEKRTATLVARAGSFELYVRWAKTQDMDPFPLDETKVYSYVQALYMHRMPATRANRFCEAMAFGMHAWAWWMCRGSCKPSGGW